MANYYGKGRTNTFLVNDVQALKVNRPGFDAHLVTGVQPLAGLCL